MYVLCVCVHDVYGWAGMPGMSLEVRGQLDGVSFSFPLYESSRGHIQITMLSWQAPLFEKPPPLP